jgi:hypothetical protein
MDSLRKFIKDIYEKKYSVRDGSRLYVFSEKIKEDERYNKLIEFFNEKYNIEGFGIKLLIKEFDLPITYSSLRNLLSFLDIKHENEQIVLEHLSNRRKINAQLQAKEHVGMFSLEIQKSLHSKKITRGIQGYYWNDYFKKYVWLRSSWEFIYAKWLNKNNIIWDVECKAYEIIEKGRKYYYRPDFFIFENNELKTIVEVKGYWKDKLFKFNNLKNKLNIDMVLITDITPYLEQNLNKEIELWKQLRKLK